MTPTPKDPNMKPDKIAIIGLGYVGLLPLAHAFAKHYEVAGFAIKSILEYSDGRL